MFQYYGNLGFNLLQNRCLVWYSISMSFSLSAIEITTWAQKIIGMVLEVRCRLHCQRKGFYNGGLHFHLLFHSLLSSMLSYFLKLLLFHPPVPSSFFRYFAHSWLPTKGDAMILCG